MAQGRAWKKWNRVRGSLGAAVLKADLDAVVEVDVVARVQVLAGVAAALVARVVAVVLLVLPVRV